MVLSTAEKAIWLVLQVILGLIPSGLLLDWIQFNCRHPLLEFANLPVYDLHLKNPTKALFNISLFFIFGLTHTGLAQIKVVNFLNKFAPPRSVFMIVTGLACLFIIAFWQPIENSEIWVLPFFDMKTNKILQFVAFYLIYSAIPFIIKPFGILEFFGFKQLFVDNITKPEIKPVLLKTGFYSISRHPMYTFTLLSFIISPIVDWNRILVVVACSIYLYFGVPIEEKKLRALFGKDYEVYQKEVPQIIPNIFRTKHKRN